MSFQLAGELAGAALVLEIGPGAVIISGTSSAPVATMFNTVGGDTAVLRLQPFTSGASVVFECDGRWMRGFVNGQLIGYVQADTASDVSTLQFSL